MKKDKPKKFLLKDVLFNKEKVERLAREIFSVHKDFDTTSFVKEVIEKFPELELKERITHITRVLKKHLPEDYLKAIKIIKKALPKELDNSLGDGDYGDFIHAPYAEYVSTYGLEKKYLNHSLNLLEEITKRFSVEFAIREFWNEHETEVYNKFIEWSKSKHYHVRRLVSEGSRPRLPWGKNIKLDYKKTEIFLDNLFSGKARYITRSVANHLNDISKFDPEFVLRKLDEWEQSKKQEKREMDFIRRHSTRTLRKKSNI